MFIFIPQTHAYEFAEGWTWKDTAIQLSVLTVTAVDTIQTHDMAKNDWYMNGHYHNEINPLFFNSRPHQDAVDILLPIGMVCHTVIAMALKPKYHVEIGSLKFDIPARKIWQLAFVGIEFGAVTNNSIHGDD